MKTRIIIATSFITTIIVLIVAVAAFALASPTLAESLPSNQVAGQAPGVAGPHPVLLPEGGGGHYWTIPGSAFVDLYSSDEYQFDLGGCKHYMAGSAYLLANAPVNLPDGSTITGMRFYFDDSVAGEAGYSTLDLREYDFLHSNASIATLNSTGSSGSGYVEINGLSWVVSNFNHFYMLHYDANYTGSSMQICSVRISYSPPSVFGYALPLIKTQ
jgi:hypothetical protein